MQVSVRHMHCRIQETEAGSRCSKSLQRQVLTIVTNYPNFGAYARVSVLDQLHFILTWRQRYSSAS